jgi:hypothetical protein
MEAEDGGLDHRIADRIFPVGRVSVDPPGRAGPIDLAGQISLARRIFGVIRHFGVNRITENKRTRFHMGEFI